MTQFWLLASFFAYQLSWYVLPTLSAATASGLLILLWQPWVGGVVLAFSLIGWGLWGCGKLIFSGGLM